MKTPIIAGSIILGLGAVTFALAQSGDAPASGPPAHSDQAHASGSSTSAGKRVEPSELRASVARLRAEVELLQLEHDLARERLSTALKESAGGIEGSPAQTLARDYMRIGAELVGKGAEFESAMQEKGDEIWKAVNKATAAPTSAEIDRLKQDFLRAATALNRKKIELVELEIHLDGSM